MSIILTILSIVGCMFLLFLFILIWIFCRACTKAEEREDDSYSN